MTDLSPAAQGVQDTADVLTAFVEEWTDGDHEKAQAALGAALYAAFRQAPHRYISGRHWVDFGVIAAVCRKML